jgi:hypothetical protein
VASQNIAGLDDHLITRLTILEADCGNMVTGHDHIHRSMTQQATEQPTALSRLQQILQHRPKDLRLRTEITDPGGAGVEVHVLIGRRGQSSACIASSLRRGPADI